MAGYIFIIFMGALHSCRKIDCHYQEVVVILLISRSPSSWTDRLKRLENELESTKTHIHDLLVSRFPDYVDAEQKCQEAMKTLRRVTGNDQMVSIANSFKSIPRMASVYTNLLSSQKEYYVAAIALAKAQDHWETISHDRFQSEFNRIEREVAIQDLNVHLEEEQENHEQSSGP